MTSRVHDIVLSLVLILISILWTWLVIQNIPPGFGDGEIGARAFPLTFGVMLFILALILLLRQFIVFANQNKLNEINNSNIIEDKKLQWIPALIILGEIILFGFLLEKIGFVLATPVIIFLVMVFNLNIRSITKVFGMSLGLTLGCWIIFEKILGLYLANGLWINLG
mgnify:CR=1 FL=1|tara:strand:+ start:817 stop:1317 length:501 start_codon:yes stop_codon:yes gene_type:complete